MTDQSVNLKSRRRLGSAGFSKMNPIRSTDPQLPLVEFIDENGGGPGVRYASGTKKVLGLPVCGGTEGWLYS
jgi:hypothetical protein